MATARIEVKMTELEPVKRALDEAAAAVTDMRAILAALTADEWAGWGFDEGQGAFACFYCHAYTEHEEHGHQHKPDCPLVKARQLLGTQPQETTEEA